MDTLEAIRTRRSIRQYLDKPVPQDVLRQVLASAMYAPSACNQQPWQFVVIDDRKLLREVPKINSYATMARSPRWRSWCAATQNWKRFPATG